MADGYGAVTGLVHLVVHAGDRHCLGCVPVASVEGQGSGTHRRCSPISRGCGNGHAGAGLAGQHDRVAIRAARAGCLCHHDAAGLVDGDG